MDIRLLRLRKVRFMEDLWLSQNKQTNKQMESAHQESAIIQLKGPHVGFYIRSYLINMTNKNMMSGNSWATYICFIFLFRW